MDKKISETERAAMGALGASLDQTDAVLAENAALKARLETAEGLIRRRKMEMTQDLTYAKFDLVTHLRRQCKFSLRTFGPGPRVVGITDHIREELREVEAEPKSLEWIDIVILALDGAWRAGFAPEQIVAAIEAKQIENESRRWPDWRNFGEHKKIKHEPAEPASEMVLVRLLDLNCAVVYYDRRDDEFVSVHESGAFARLRRNRDDALQAQRREGEG